MRVRVRVKVRIRFRVRVRIRVSGGGLLPDLTLHFLYQYTDPM